MSDIPLPENNFFGNNDSRYSHPELDGLIERFLSSVSLPDRVTALGGILRHTSENQPLIGLVYRPDPAVASARVRNLTGWAADGAQTWNAREWEVR